MWLNFSKNNCTDTFYLDDVYLYRYKFGLILNFKFILLDGITSFFARNLKLLSFFFFGSLYDLFSFPLQQEWIATGSKPEKCY